jgi:hypothetical protein
VLASKQVPPLPSAVDLVLVIKRTASPESLLCISCNAGHR